MNAVKIALVAVCLSAVVGCSFITGIFKAGVWVGILFVVAIIALVIFLISKMGGGSK